MSRLIFTVNLIGVVGLFLFSGGSAVSYQDSHRFGSFAPVQDGNDAKWFVDGEDYMSAVADAILSAEYEIFITAWQLNPHIFLKRPEAGVTNLEWRLDKVLLRKAEEVKIYIILYWEINKLPLVGDILDTGSKYVQQFLNNDNITVIRHPDFFTTVTSPLDLRWSHHEKIVVIDRSIAFVGGIDLAFGRWDTHEHSLVDNYHVHPCVKEGQHCEQSFNEEHMKYQRWVGKDYGNTFVGGTRKDFDKPLLDYIDRKSVPRMPWHDVSCAFTGPAVRDVAKHFIQLYNFIISGSFMKQLFYRRQTLSMETRYENQNSYPLFNSSASNVRIQVLRSLSEWSGGQPKEDSILKAYLHAIEHSKHMIYIENQFFISSQPKGMIVKVFNSIQKALSDRIVRAYEEKQDFHVFIILPLKPDFDGQWGEGKIKDSITYWNDVTLHRGEDSLVGRISKKLPEKDIGNYLSVYGLRTHSILNNSVVTEIIYVHSKLMIVDDEITIIGSANINDRSMLGNRDSEVNVIIEDRSFSYGLRYHLFKEHFGVFNSVKNFVQLDPVDPLEKKFYTDLQTVASCNTKIYEKVFRPKILPTDQVPNLQKLKEWLNSEGIADQDQEEAKEELEGVRGRLVTFPSNFLKDLKSCTKCDIPAIPLEHTDHSSVEDHSFVEDYDDADMV